MKWTKLELSLMVGIAAALFWCAAEPHVLADWWGVAFEPLCDGILRAGSDGADLILRSRFAELIGSLFS